MNIAYHFLTGSCRHAISQESGLKNWRQLKKADAMGTQASQSKFVCANTKSASLGYGPVRVDIFDRKLSEMQLKWSCYDPAIRVEGWIKKGAMVRHQNYCGCVKN